MIFLKLGGSLITDKNQPRTPRLDVIRRIASDITKAFQSTPNMKLLLGHGSGSFGHFVADQFGTQLGASSEEEWYGFAQVWAAANQLNRMVVDSLLETGLPVLSFPPSASVISRNNSIEKLAIEPIRHALDAGLIPIVQGDVAFDRKQGSTIVSTEQIFEYLAPTLKPNLVLLAGIEAGVYGDYPTCEKIIKHITEANSQDFSIEASAAPDVTGGMATKVQQALTLCKLVENLEVRIFSGEGMGTIREALNGATVGTLLTSISKRTESQR
jgi:isopentenyl phosphate kinase